jgi:glycine dehydrogenase
MLMSALKPLDELENPAEFTARHIGPSADDERHMLSVIGAHSSRPSCRAASPAPSRCSCPRR